MNIVPRLIDTFKPTHYDLQLTLEREQRRFNGQVTINGTTKADDTVSLHSKDLAITTVSVNGTSADFDMGVNDELKIATGIASGQDIIIVVEFNGKITDSMHGLYPSYFEVEGVKKELLATQFESHHAREVFPCIDEPAAKATFDVTLTTEVETTVLGNMPIASQQNSDGKLVTTFTTTPKMSSYLLAFVVGELQKKTAKTKDGVEVNVYATLAQSPASLDFALDHAVKSIEFYDEFFGVDYPLPKSDHVALPDFSSGAMENWGLVTYREVALLADPATTTLTSKEYIATVISHELSHQWFGNLVTMEWWNDLWLNESFATIMEYIAVDAIHPEYNIMLDFASNESILALRRDAIDGVQSVRTEVHHPDEISTIFDGAIVYAKGARLLNMCRNFIGASAFQAGLRQYFQKFSYQNTVASDLWSCLSETSDRDIANFMAPWLNQSGYPVLDVESNSLTQKQFFIGPHEPSSKIWPIPLDAESSEDIPALLETSRLMLDVADDERFNIHNAGHYLTKYSPDHLKLLLSKLATFDELTRLQLLNEQVMLARGSETSSDLLIDLLDIYRHETSDSVWSIMSLALSELKSFVENDKAAETKLRTFAGELARDEFTRLGWNKVPDEPESDTKLRSIILGMMIYSEQPEIIAYCDQLYKGGIDRIDPEVRALVLAAVVRNSDAKNIVTTLLDIYRSNASTDIREDICIALTSAKRPEHITEVIAQLNNKDTVRPQDIFRFFAYLIRNRYARDASWQWMVDNWSYIEITFAGDKSYDNFPRYSAAGLVTKEQLANYRAFFTPHRDEPALKRNIDLGILEIEGRIALLDRDGPAVITKLNQLP